jgi:hypothetical protein
MRTQAAVAKSEKQKSPTILVGLFAELQIQAKGNLPSSVLNFGFLPKSNVLRECYHKKIFMLGGNIPST